MGGRGSGGGRSGGGSASKAPTISDKNMVKAQNYLEKAYKYQDDYENYAELADTIKVFRKGLRMKVKLKKPKVMQDMQKT